jgi:hypothetical protein
MQSAMAAAKRDFAQSGEYAVEGPAAAIASGVLRVQCLCLSSLAYYHAFDRGNYDEAIKLTEEALALFRSTGGKWGVALHLIDLSFFRALHGQYAQAEAVCAEVIVLAQQLADRFLTAYFLMTLAASQGGTGSR